MNSRNISRVIARFVAFVVIGVVTIATAWAQGGGRPCSVESIAGSWMFGTDVGMASGADNTPITALGTMNIDKAGNLSGVFNATVADIAFIANCSYTGNVTVGSDCRATVNFVDCAGGSRTDSAVIVSNDEMWGMSQDPDNLWTYRMQRVSRAAGAQSLAEKVDALLRRLGLVPGGFENSDE